MSAATSQDLPTAGYEMSTTNNDGSGPKPEPKNASVWLSMFALMIATFLAAMDTSAVSTALPTIVNHFNGKEFVWVGPAYTLSGTAFLPMSVHLANIFGRRPILLVSFPLFALGSALCGGAQSMSMLIGGQIYGGVILTKFTYGGAGNWLWQNPVSDGDHSVRSRSYARVRGVPGHDWTGVVYCFSHRPSGPKYEYIRNVDELLTERSGRHVCAETRLDLAWAIFLG
ncbi:uncharacterized protein PHACADRAFT_179780 [Phanerochaete carnosa HHB-10118-sp]|uniref:Major facilitator superfamily (MFS) profile domain-containing protein n=1 Tax=Phanerochaete carnosa (strain HHB-10118-sp) TaxID=650164 RepID=K5WM71_PHACS|nr:uncharacterized protein PHACADRAFT_179780 [Phanerochaete carnosa HHB-10118-sp]EKM60535.1 hypothetical protein PHACADRAFT_179780 [Phanerochaete carnosa HHB-10118-sp]